MSIVSHCCQDNQGLAERLAEIDALVEAQAEDEGLWSVPAEGTQRIAEAYLQQELRRLHAVIEGTRQAQKETAVPASDTYAAGGNPGTVVEPGPLPVAQARQDAFVRATEIEMERAKQRMFADLNDPTKCACSAEGACLAHETTAQDQPLTCPGFNRPCGTLIPLGGVGGLCTDCAPENLAAQDREADLNEAEGRGYIRGLKAAATAISACQCNLYSNGVRIAYPNKTCPGCGLKLGASATQAPFADFCAKCVHPKGWHRKNEAACIECGCLEFTAHTSNASKEPL